MEKAAIREFRPEAVPAQFFVWGPLLSGFLAIFPGFFTFVLSNMIAGGFEPVVRYGLAAYVVSFLVILALVGAKVFLGPSLTTYAIYRDRIEYEEGLLNRNRRTLLFDQVMDVRLSEGVLQRTRGVGTVTLVTQQLVSAGEGHLTNRSIRLANVPDPRGVYDLIRSLALEKAGR